MASYQEQDAALAHMVEHCPSKSDVVGSSPTRRSINIVSNKECRKGKAMGAMKYAA